MKLIVGLGNPGTEYQNTRHNIGFQVIDYLANKLGTKLIKKNFNGLYDIINYQGEDFILLKPQTYMNKSGECLRDFVNYYRISNQDFIVVYDDLTLPLGHFRYRQQGSNGGHNGVKDIIECLKNSYFKRLKVGIGSNPEILWKDWVLQKFSYQEQVEIKKILPNLTASLLKWMEGKTSFERLMNIYNK